MKNKAIIKAIIGTMLTLIVMSVILFGVTLLDYAPDWVNWLLFALAVIYSVIYIFGLFYKHFKEK